MTGAIKMTKLDLMTMKAYRRSYFIYLAYPFIFSFWSVSGMASMSAAMLSMLSVSIFSVQEKNNMERLYGTLGLSDKEILAGRYFFLLLNNLLVLLIALPLHLVIAAVRGELPSGGEIALAFGLGLAVFWFMAGIQAPLCIRYGYSKSRFSILIPVIIIAVAPALLVLVMGDKVSEVVASAINRWADSNSVSAYGAAALMLAAGCLFALISYWVSTKCYRAKKL